ncbi:helix-turn-helix transcriptional regulator [Micrococcus endophyticus]
MNAPTAPDRAQLWTPDRLADFLGVPIATVYRWRSTGDGPRGFRVGKHVRYADEDVTAWIDAQRDADADAR